MTHGYAKVNHMSQLHPLDTLTESVNMIQVTETMLILLNRMGLPETQHLRTMLVALIKEQDKRCQQARIALDPPYMDGELSLNGKRNRGILSTADYWQEWFRLFMQAQAS